MYEEKISEYKKSKEDLEINLSQNIVNFKMKEDELDTLLMVIEGILVNICLIFRAKGEINMIIILLDYPLRRNEALRKL
jgi:hypothetical protein